MAPSTFLRHQARVLAARAGAASAVFLAIAIMLLAGGWNGPLASAEATNGEATPAPLEEPVAGGDTVDLDDVVDHTIPPVAPVDEGPVGETPDEGTETPGEDGTETPGDGDEDPTSGGDKDGDGVTDPVAPPDDGGQVDEDLTPPSGGGKGEEPTDDPDGDQPEPEPDPSGRPQVTLPLDPSEPVGPTAPPGSEEGEEPTIGTGEGNMNDADELGGTSGGGDKRVRFGVAADNDGGVPAGGDTGDGGALPAGTELAALQPSEEQPGDGGTSPSGGDENGGGGSGDGESNVVTRTVDRLVEVVPDELKAALAALAALSIMLGIGYLLAALRARRLARQRRELLQEVGLLQTALLPPVPDKVGALLTSVAYRPADGPGAGGDFYDVLPLTGGRVGFILGDVSGHGRGALARTAFMRYTLRAYLEAGLEPRVALQVAGRVIDDNLGGDFATVLLAVHDPDTGSLTYASAGHPSPIVVGPQPHDPITAASSPPIGVGVRTGLRQTTVPLVPGAVACLFTDGLVEARTADGILGRERLTELLEEIVDDASARRLIERVAAEANVLSDDMAAVVVSPTAGVTTGQFRTEQLELSTRELEGPIARRFLEACGLPDQEVEDAERDARLLAERFGGVVLHVVFGNRLRVEVLPRNVESIEAASRRVSAGSPQ